MNARVTFIRSVVQCALLLALMHSMNTFGAGKIQVTVSGLAGEALDNVMASLSIVERQQDQGLDTQGIRALHDKAQWQIRRALEPFGYYRPTISTSLLPPDDTHGSWRASYHIDAGDKVRIERVDISVTGPGAESDERLRAALSFNMDKGAVLDHRRYEQARDALLEQARSEGYLDARLGQHQVKVDLADYTAAVTLQLVSGPRYTFGPVSFGDTRLSKTYLSRYLLIQEGAPYDPATVSRQRVALSKSGHFREVSIIRGEAGDTTQAAVPLHIELAPFKPNRYRGRMGWGTDYGLGVQLDWTRRYAGRRGQHFTLGGTVVEERKRLAGDASYTVPMDPLAGSSLEFVARHESKELTFEEVDLEEGGETRIATNLASLFWHLPYREWGGFEFRRSMGLSLVGETYDVFEVLFGNLPDAAQNTLIELIGQETYDTLSPDFQALVPRLRLNLRRYDDPLYIRRGDYYNLEFLGTDESLGSNINFWQARLNTWNIFPMGDTNRLLLRSAWGYSEADSDNALGINFNQMPEYFEFRAGGARSVRGYGFEELFAADTITGGKHLAVASVEYEHEFIANFSAAVFLDAGNAFNDFDDIGEKLGAGFGLRWRSPVGLARIDVGFPLDDAEDSFQIYITVGPEF